MISRLISTKTKSVLIVSVLTLCVFVNFQECSSFKSSSGSLKIALKLGSSELDFDNNLLQKESFTIKITGRHFERQARIGNDGLFWQDIPENLYKFELMNGQGNIEFTSNFRINKGRLTELELHWIGNDHRMVSVPRMWTAKITGGWGEGYRWMNNDWQKTYHADGRVEIFHHGVVFGRNTDGKTFTRFDWDNDLISDLDDSDDDNDGIYDDNDRDDDNDGIVDLKDDSDTDDDNNGVINQLEVRELILGNLQWPVIEDFSVTNLDTGSKSFTAEPGNLLKLDFKINRAGGKPIDQVNCGVFSNAIQRFQFSPVDDGSLEDLNNAHQGRQISGDLVMGDGNYSIILPLDIPTWRKLYPSIISCQAINMIGKKSQQIFMFPSSSDNFSVSSAESNVHEQVESVKIQLFKNDLGNLADKLNLNLRLKKPLIVKVYMEHRSIFLEPEKKTLKFAEYSDTFSVPRESIFLMTVLDTAGDVYYSGERFN